MVSVLMECPTSFMSIEVDLKIMSIMKREKNIMNRFSSTVTLTSNINFDSFGSFVSSIIRAPEKGAFLKEILE